MAEDGLKARIRQRFGFWRVIATVFLGVWAVLLLAVAGAGLVAYLVYDHVTSPGLAGPVVAVVVPKGATGRDVGRLLAEEGLLEYEGFFRLALELDARDSVIQHGVYDLPRGYSAMQLLDELYAGPDRHLDANRVRITIPEGLTIVQMAAMFEDPEAFKAAARAPALIEQVGIQANSLEGFLMPDTYFFDETPTARALVTRMAGQFQKVYGELMAAIPGAAQYDKRRVVTVASLVEEEARVARERPLVAAVVYNRLDRNMPLQMDATLQYALGKYGQRMLDSDLQVDSPYNTYKYPGLPPGPISNPGEDSLRAALLPADEDYLYFVSNADGKTHTFSKTLDEHNRALAQYRRDIAVQRRQLREESQ